MLPLKNAAHGGAAGNFRIRHGGNERQCSKTMDGGALEPNWREPRSICVAIGRASAQGRLGRHSDGGRLRGRRGRCEILKSSMGFPKNAIGPILHKSQKKKRNRRRREESLALRGTLASGSQRKS